MLKFVNIEAKEIVPAFFRSCFNRVGHRARGGRPPPPSSSQAPVPQPTSLAKPASAPAHPRPVSPKCTPAGTNPTELHALTGIEQMKALMEQFLKDRAGG